MRKTLKQKKYLKKQKNFLTLIESVFDNPVENDEMPVLNVPVINDYRFDEVHAIEPYHNDQLTAHHF